MVIIQIRFFVFWCGWFQVFVVEIRITIITATFLPEQVASPSTTAAPTTVTQITPEKRKYLIIVSSGRQHCSSR